MGKSWSILVKTESFLALWTAEVLVEKAASALSEEHVAVLLRIRGCSGRVSRAEGPGGMVLL